MVRPPDGVAVGVGLAVGVGDGAADAVGLGLPPGPPNTSSSSTVKPDVPAYWLRYSWIQRLLVPAGIVSVSVPPWPVVFCTTVCQVEPSGEVRTLYEVAYPAPHTTVAWSMGIVLQNKIGRASCRER